MRSFSAILFPTFISTTLAFIGPNTNVYIGNKVISPDGVARSWVDSSSCIQEFTNTLSAVLAGADANSLSFPGPAIRGVKVDICY